MRAEQRLAAEIIGQNLAFHPAPGRAQHRLQHRLNPSGGHDDIEFQTTQALRPIDIVHHAGQDFTRVGQDRARVLRQHGKAAVVHDRTRQRIERGRDHRQIGAVGTREGIGLLVKVADALAQFQPTLAECRVAEHDIEHRPGQRHGNQQHDPRQCSVDLQLAIENA